MANRKCFACGAEYDYCPSCQDDLRPAWMTMFCSEDCKKVFRACSAFTMGSMNAEQAKKELEGVEFGDYSKFKEDSQKVLSQIYANDEKKGATEVDLNDATEKEDTQAVQKEAVVEDTKTSNKTYNNYSRSYKNSKKNNR